MSRAGGDPVAGPVAGPAAVGTALAEAEVARVSAEVMPLDEATVRDLTPLVANLRALARAVDRAMGEGDGVAASVDAVTP
ncbi:MAG: hypothetical protein H0U69_14360 [Trueperaceae bacterium]|nr:hypothetical protein [Trueperaceae bacterium]